MSLANEVYSAIKEVLAIAKKIKNQDAIEKIMDLQEKFFELREENDTLEHENQTLKNEIERLQQSDVLEKDITYSPKGFFTISSDNPKIPYCSCCWKKERKLIPLSQKNSWFQYRCGNCQSDVIVIDGNGKDLNDK